MSVNGYNDALRKYIDAYPFDGGDSGCEIVLDQLYQAYAESHESDPPEIGNGFKELEEFLCNLLIDDNNAVFNICCRLYHRSYYSWYMVFWYSLSSQAFLCPSA